MPWEVAIWLVPAALGLSTFFWFWSRYEEAEPNQWLLLIRNGKPQKAGIGIRIWRRPGDAIARFTSTMQRVTFDTEVYTQDKQKIQVKGFILWAINPDEEGPFRAFYKLGIANQPVGDRPEAHHALSRPQHHAFRRSVEAVVRKAAVNFPLRTLLSTPTSLNEHIQEDLSQTIATWGILLEAIEVNELRVSQEELFSHLQAPYIEQSRQEAEEVQLASSRHIRELRLEQEKALALKEAQTHQQKDVEIARLRLETEQQTALLFEEELEVKQRYITQEASLQKMKEETEHQAALEALARREEEEAREAELRHKASAQTQARLLEELQARVARQRLEQEAEREHLTALLAIEKDKPELVRNAELSRELVQHAAQALEQLPIQEIRWLSADKDGPSGLLLGLLDTLQQIARPTLVEDKSFEH